MDTQKVAGDLTIAASQFKKERAYWLNKLAGEIVKSYFPYDFTENGRLDRQIASVAFTFLREPGSRIIKASNNSDSRLFMILAAGVIQLLKIFTGSEDIIIGIPISKQAVEGKLINTVLPIRISYDAGMTFRKLLIQVRHTIIEAGENQNYPIDILPNELNMIYSRDEDFPLFDVLILLENIHDKRYIQHVNINLIFTFIREGEDISLVVEYNSLKYEEDTIKRIFKYLMAHLSDLIGNADRDLSGFDVLSEEEKKRFIIDFNKTRTGYLSDKTIQELIEQQVESTPAGTAVRFQEKQISYKELNERAENLAQILKIKGIKENTIVGVMGERSLETIIVILGIVKAGGAFLPINAQDPFERIEYIIEDSKAQLLITDNHAFHKNREILNSMPEDNVIFIEELLLGNGKEKKPRSNRAAGSRVLSRQGDIAYVIYTSGTTGRPKGVIIGHQSLVNYIQWAAKHYVGKKRVNFPFFTSFSFDMTITSIFTPLVTGNAVVVYGGDEKDFILERVIEDNRVDIIKTTPSHLKMIRDNTIENTAVKRFIIGGEKFESQLAKDIYENFGKKSEIYNEYGPTEATVGCMIHKFNPTKDIRNSVPIGIPADNTEIYLLDAGHSRSIPIGVMGELFISGDGLAEGYLNKTELTNERFIRNPFISSRKMFRTGDAARRLSDGHIEFIGRLDNQVKIRGYRVELGEIENQLQKYNGIKEAIVFSREDALNETFLCSYYVADKELSTSELNTYLRKKIPDYMLPQFFIKVERIPLKPSGKIDIGALPEPEVKRGEKYLAPSNDMEKKLVEIWSEILGVEKTVIGIHDNFFELGGHSLSATTLVMKIFKEFDFKLPLQDVFKSPTVSGISSIIESTEWVNYKEIKSDQDREEISI